MNKILKLLTAVLLVVSIGSINACKKTFDNPPGAADPAIVAKVWAALARKMGPQALRMNLNILLRHGVFSVEQLSSTASEASTIVTPDKRLGQ